MNPFCGLAASFVRSYLNDYPFFLAVLFFAIACSLGYFGFLAIVNRSTYDKWGNPIEGGMAVFNGIMMLIGAVICGGVCLFQFGKGLSDARLLDSFARRNDEVQEVGSRDSFRGKLKAPEPGTPFVRPSMPDSPFTSDSFIGARNSQKPRQDATAEQLAKAFGQADENEAASMDSGNPFAEVEETEEPEDYETYLPGAATDLPVAADQLPTIGYQLANAQKSKSVGGRSGSEFNDHGPAGSLLVGVRVSVRPKTGKVRGLQPIYQKQGQYFYGKPLGSVKSTQLLLAKPGYVVGGVIVSGGTSLSSIKLKYLNMDPSTGELDEFDQYDSEVVGKIMQPVELFAKGWHAVGLFGNQTSDEVVSLGLAAVQATVGGDSVAAGAPATSDYRVWHNQSREFSVEAKFSSLQNGKVTLLKKDGSEIEVAVDTLCDEDQQWLQNKS